MVIIVAARRRFCAPGNMRRANSTDERQRGVNGELESLAIVAAKAMRDRYVNAHTAFDAQASPGYVISRLMR